MSEARAWCYGVVTVLSRCCYGISPVLVRCRPGVDTVLINRNGPQVSFLTTPCLPWSFTQMPLPSNSLLVTPAGLLVARSYPTQTAKNRYRGTLPDFDSAGLAAIQGTLPQSESAKTRF